MENAPGASTIEYAVEIGRSIDEGLVVLPVAGPVDTPASVVRLHAPLERRSIAWTAARLGGPPTVPAWDSFLKASNPNVVFLGGQQTAVIPTPVVNGHWFIIAGRYDYGLIVAEGLGSLFRLGKMPWEQQGVDINDIPPQFFDPVGILSGKGPPSGLPPLLIPIQK